MKSYRSRVLDDLFARRSQTAGAILAEGIKWCGKTTTCEQEAKSVVYLDEPEKREHNLLMAKIRPSEILDGMTPRLIDEWQHAPQFWDAIRYRVDHADARGRFLLTGSAVPPDDSEIRHSGTGRYAWLKMRSMSLLESASDLAIAEHYPRAAGFDH